MTMKIAINGFGRIGRLLFRAAAERKANIEVVAVNDLAPATTLGHLLKNDSVHGHPPFSVKVEANKLIVDGKPIKVLSERDPSNLPLKDLGVYLAVESTGLFRDREKASLNLKAGAKKVLISAPAKNPDFTVVLGVNHEKYDHANHNIISNASCTTNCVSPVAKVLNDNFGLEKALMTTAHAYTNDQRIQDLVHKDLRRGRAGALSIIPTTTGAAKAASIVLPELTGKMNGLALRVPTPNVSIVDLTALLKKDATAADINNAFKTAAQGSLKGILDYTDEPLVSVDYNHNPYSATIDGPSTMVIGGNLAKILAWYDNEWGFSCRMVELMELIGKKAGL
ncbi:MAG: type I glyceraldehyde-3-phosphate dehydrogenase [Candidatus Bathyarchaeota archaeon]|nr:MAG: type I glyceraldehyde-3-phosphate dehydrogenase [Candidatus Bathyarchaeota archaeon]